MEKTFAHQIPDKRLVSRMYEVLQLNNKKIRTHFFFKENTIWEDISPKKNGQLTRKIMHIISCSGSGNQRNDEILLTSTKMASIKKTWL